MHYEHEAFRFKYCPSVSKELEAHIMGPLCKILYFNNFLYYFIVIGCPIIFTRNATCDGHLEEINLIYSHYIYAVFAFYNIIFEITAVIYI